MLRNIGKNATAHVATPDDAGDRHSDEGGRDTDENHGAQVDTERAGDQNRTGRWRHKRIASGKSREQRDAVVERRLLVCDATLNASGIKTTTPASKNTVVPITRPVIPSAQLE